ncbi:hypothetical protein L1887_42631 [Cichorium endivia]|nr:hypothetical protein L1887_42631 [Cichorium endivia]
MMTQRGGEGVNPGEGRVILLCDDGRQDGAVGSYDTSTRVIAGRLDAQDEPRFGGAAEGAKGSVFASKTREVVDPTNSPRAYRSYKPHAALACPVQLVPSGSSGRKRRCGLLVNVRRWKRLSHRSPTRWVLDPGRRRRKEAAKPRGLASGVTAVKWQFSETGAAKKAAGRKGSSDHNWANALGPAARSFALPPALMSWQAGQAPSRLAWLA